MHIRDLALSDVDNLLEFELENRVWFEQFIAARPDNFFSAAMVRDHIRAYLLSRQQGKFHGCVVVDESGKIIARANLREINLKRATAEIGYRVGQAYCGRGVASSATRYLIGLAYNEWKIKQLGALVITHNIASARVLEKNGFVKVALHTRMAAIKSGRFDCFEYRHVHAKK